MLVWHCYLMLYKLINLCALRFPSTHGLDNDKNEKKIMTENESPGWEENAFLLSASLVLNNWARAPDLVQFMLTLIVIYHSFQFPLASREKSKSGVWTAGIEANFYYILVRGWNWLSLWLRFWDCKTGNLRCDCVTVNSEWNVFYIESVVHEIHPINITKSERNGDSYTWMIYRLTSLPLPSTTTKKGLKKRKEFITGSRTQEVSFFWLVYVSGEIGMRQRKSWTMDAAERNAVVGDWSKCRGRIN